MLKSLTLISCMILISCSAFDYTIYTKKTFTGEIVYLWKSSNSNSPNTYGIGIKMENGDTKLFETTKSIASHIKNYEEARRIHKLHKIDDTVTITWYFREEKRPNETSQRTK